MFTVHIDIYYGNKYAFLQDITYNIVKTLFKNMDLEINIIFDKFKKDFAIW